MIGVRKEVFRNCSGPRLLLQLSTVLRCSLNLSFKRLLVSSTNVLYVTTVALYQVDEIFSVTNEVRFYSACFAGRKKGILRDTVINVWASSPVLSAAVNVWWELLSAFSRNFRKQFSFN